jgi:hypothetical protein
MVNVRLCVQPRLKRPPGVAGAHRAQGRWDRSWGGTQGCDAARPHSSRSPPKAAVCGDASPSHVCARAAVPPMTDDASSSRCESGGIGSADGFRLGGGVKSVKLRSRAVESPCSAPASASATASLPRSIGSAADASPSATCTGESHSRWIRGDGEAVTPSEVADGGCRTASGSGSAAAAAGPSSHSTGMLPSLVVACDAADSPLGRRRAGGGLGTRG